MLAIHQCRLRNVKYRTEFVELTYVCLFGGILTLYSAFACYSRDIKLWMCYNSMAAFEGHQNFLNPQPKKLSLLILRSRSSVMASHEPGSEPAGAPQLTDIRMH